MNQIHLIGAVFISGCLGAGSLAFARGAEAPDDSTRYGWKLTFSDEFDDAEAAIAKGADPSCFSQKPKCMIQYWTDTECDASYQAQLRNLNKCNWRVYQYYNYMDLGAKAGVDAINAFDPSQVHVENGTLRLSANRSPYAKSELDCKNDYFEPRSGTTEKTRKCGIFSGGIEARPFQKAAGGAGGFAQAYGRFEVRAKLTFGPGTWPAFWLLPHEAWIQPSSCGWPFAGEIDINESYAKSPGKVNGGIVTGDCSRNLQGGQGYTWSPGGLNQAEKMSSEYHVFGVEWAENSVRFFVDGEFYGSFYEGAPIDARAREGEDAGKVVGKIPARIPKGLFYWILNLSVANGAGKNAATRPDLDHFPEQNLVIDYVRTYSRCTKEDPASKCVKFDMLGGADDYNSYRGETAYAEVNAFPNPVRRSDPMGVRFTSKQRCEEFRVDLIDMLGREVAVDSPDASPDRRFLFNGPINANQDVNTSIRTDALASGMYFVRATYEKCGDDRTGRGNQVFKFMVMD